MREKLKEDISQKNWIQMSCNPIDKILHWSCNKKLWSICNFLTKVLSVHHV